MKIMGLFFPPKLPFVLDIYLLIRICPLTVLFVLRASDFKNEKKSRILLKRASHSSTEVNSNTSNEASEEDLTSGFITFKQRSTTTYKK